MGDAENLREISLLRSLPDTIAQSCFAGRINGDSVLRSLSYDFVVDLEHAAHAIVP